MAASRQHRRVLSSSKVSISTAGHVQYVRQYVEGFRTPSDAWYTFATHESTNGIPSVHPVLQRSRSLPTDRPDRVLYRLLPPVNSRVGSESGPSWVGLDWVGFQEMDPRPTLVSSRHNLRPRTRGLSTAWSSFAFIRQ